MQRRKFIKEMLLTSTGMLFLPSVKVWGRTARAGADFSSDPLLQAGPSARPWSFWMWMNGNITKQGITLDLEAMQRMGIGGVINFNSAVGIPRGPVDYAGEEWIDCTLHAIKEADRLGISYTIHNAPGYSGCGGPWVTPEMSMQELVWTENRVASMGNVDVVLKRPYAKYGYYKDALVIAYPSLKAEKALMNDQLHRVYLDGEEVDKNIITDKSPETKIRMGPAKDGGTSFLTLEFTGIFEARSITITRKAEVPHDLFDGPRDNPPLFHLEYADDNLHFQSIGKIQPPELREMDTPASLSFDVVNAKYYRLSVTAPTWISEVELHNISLLGGWPGKTNYTHGNSNGEAPRLTDELIIHSDTVRDLSGFMNKEGRLVYDLPKGNWTIFRIGHTTTGEECAAHPDAGAGLEIDKFRKEALQLHFDQFLDKIITKAKPYVGKSFKGITVDSYEAGKQNWTPGFEQIFKDHSGYSIVQWMPAMTGRIVNSREETEKFLWDMRRVQADLLSENFYGHYQELCHQRGLEFYAEPYGDGNLDSLQIAEHLDITMSEFWTRYIYGSDNYSKQAVSAAHIYGKKIVAAEAFTAMPATAKWTDYPYSLKAEGDYFFSLGVNRLVFHTFVHQPYTTGFPGMTMGPFGTHFDRNNTWTEQAWGWAGYLARTQHILQQGTAVVDFCYFKGDNPETGVPDVDKWLPQGYKADVFGPDALMKHMSVKNGQIEMNGGMRYAVCVMAKLDTIQPGTFNKLKQLVADGMTLVVSNKPQSVPGRYVKNEVFANAINELYGNLDGVAVADKSFGNGKLVWATPDLLLPGKLNIAPDFEYTAANQDTLIHYLHLRIQDADVYFISNHRRRSEKITAAFRIAGKLPEIIDTENNTRRDALLYRQMDGRTLVFLELAPAGSLFVIFKKDSAKDGYYSLIKDSKPIQEVKTFTKPELALYKDTFNTFTISIWIKPDTFAHKGRSMLFHPAEGNSVYGVGHAIMAMGGGQNGIRVYERAKGTMQEVLFAEKPVQGWTLVTVIYEQGIPRLYYNGELKATGKRSPFTIHPGLFTPPSTDQFTTFFEGNATVPELVKEALSEEKIRQYYINGLPAPVMPEGVCWEQTKAGKARALIWENGSYNLRSSSSEKLLGTINDCSKIAVTGSWKVYFPAASAASMVLLPELRSLHLHKDFDIKHFSGTATYVKYIEIPMSSRQPGKRLFLHLGRVEVIASVKLNGKEVGLLWKEPFMADITTAAKTGNNLLEIEVTNLWPNRLIGDERLPAENQYTKDNNITALPGWYVHNQDKKGERKSFATWHTYGKDYPLFESGLLGPVTLITAIEKEI